MRSRYHLTESEGVYFLTATVVEWIPLFVGLEACCILTDALAYCRREKGLRIYAYVIMENHIHLVAQGEELGHILQSFKRHTAKKLLQWLRETKKEWVLNQLAYFKKSYKEESRHQVWQEGSHPQLVKDEAMFNQKAEYIHGNPVRRGWVDAPEHWRYSSARNYLLGDQSVLEIDVLPSIGG